MTNKTRILLLTALLMSCLLISCNGMFGDIYDTAPMDTEFRVGFTRVDESPRRFTLMIDARDYDKWHYINLSDFTIESISIPDSLGENDWDGRSGWSYNEVEGTKYTQYDFKPTVAQIDADNWDFAIHHFDIRTNGGSAAITDHTSLDGFSLSDAKAFDDKLEYDIWTTTQVITDLTGMMAFRIGYQNNYVSIPLSTMVTMDFSTPPPTYHALGKVCVLRLSDGSYAAINLKNYMSPQGTKGFLTFDIIYPL